MSSARPLLKKLSGLSSGTKRALGLGVLVAGLASFAACQAAHDEEGDSNSARNSSSLPDWSNDTTKYRPR